MPQVTYDRFELGIDRRKGRGVADSNRLYDLKNCHVTTGWAVQKRPGLTKIADLAAGSKGLTAHAGGLHTYSAVYNPTHPSGSDGVAITNHQLPYSADASDDISDVHFNEVFNAAIYVAIEYQSGAVEHNYLSGSAPYYITDANCPQTKAGLRIASKIWAVNGDTVAFTATGDPTDWTTASDAGFLPTGLKTPGTEDALGLGNFNGELAVFMEDAVQVWAVDPDPSQNAIEEVIPNVGTTYPLSIFAVSKDLFFLAPSGYRSVALQKFTNNRIDLDVGTPIDSIVTPLLTPTLNTRAIYFAGGGQYWSAVGNTVHVYTFSRTAKVSAWSYYEYPFTIDAWAQLGADLYIRTGDVVYKVDPNVHTDDGTLYDVLIETAYQSAKRPGIMKQYTGLDLVSVGSGTVQHRYDSRDPDLITDPVAFSNDTRPGPLYPVEVVATEIATVIKNRDADPFRVDAFTYFYDLLAA